jgi:tetratricopeptide (TPR) repeat protein
MKKLIAALRHLNGVKLFLALALVVAGNTAFAQVSDDVLRVRSAWEKIKYKTPEKEQEQAFEQLAKESARVKEKAPKDAAAAIWHGIVEASYAGAKGGLGALGLAKSAKKSFEDALAIDPKALEGSAYTSLGSLYYQVPGWPIGFGDDKMALDMLNKGLALNPNGIDPNYFYADFLFRNGDLDGAEQALKKALAAPLRDGRALADEGRRKEIAELQSRIAKKRK